MSEKLLAAYLVHPGARAVLAVIAFGWVPVSAIIERTGLSQREALSLLATMKAKGLVQYKLGEVHHSSVAEAEGEFCISQKAQQILEELTKELSLKT